MTDSSVQSVNDLNFSTEVLESDVPVLVDFTATWCGPCRQIAPLVEQLAGEYQGRIKVTKLDIDDSPSTAQRFGIRGVPTLYVFKGGEIVAQQVGAVPKKVISEMLDRSLT